MTTREQAIKWFNEKDAYNKSELSHKYFKESVSYNFSALTGREIEEIWRKENKQIENIYLKRLREQYKGCKEHEKLSYSLESRRLAFFVYENMRLFCLDTQLVSFNDIEAMEYEVNTLFA